MRNNRLLPYETIVQATSGEPEAVGTVLQYYRRRKMCIRDRDEELADLQASFPTVWGQYIEKLSEYMASVSYTHLGEL